MPRWEKSKNRHGYWDGSTRMAYIGVRRGNGIEPASYGWVIYLAPFPEGRSHTLSKAKKICEAEVARLLSVGATVGIVVWR